MKMLLPPQAVMSSEMWRSTASYLNKYVSEKITDCVLKTEQTEDGFREFL